MNAPHLVIVDTFAPLTTTAQQARQIWAGRVRARRAARFLSPCWHEAPCSCHKLRIYAELRRGLNGPTLYQLGGVIRNRGPVRWFALHPSASARDWQNSYNSAPTFEEAWRLLQAAATKEIANF